MIHKFLIPGRYYIAKKPVIIETLVGSCVSVCLYNCKKGFAAMNHFLRDRPEQHASGNIGEYGTTATAHIIDALMKVDSEPSHYRAQVFGGAAVIKAVGSDGDIGRRNVEVALETLAKARIRVIKKEVGGTRGRRIKFNTETGTVEYRFAGDIPRKSRRS